MVYCKQTCDDALKTAMTIQDSKLDIKTFEKQRDDQKLEYDRINADLDRKENAIKTIESFTDRYIPVRILYIMRECFVNVLSRSQL